MIYNKLDEVKIEKEYQKLKKKYLNKINKIEIDIPIKKREKDNTKYIFIYIFIFSIILHLSLLYFN